MLPPSFWFGRVCREFSRRLLSVWPLAKVRPDSVPAGCESATKSREISDDVSLVTKNPHPGSTAKDITSTLDLIQRVEIMMNACAMAGMKKVVSKMAPGTKVEDCHINDANAYLAFIRQCVRAHPGSDSEIISWVIERDCQTRTKAVARIRMALGRSSATQLHRIHGGALDSRQRNRSPQCSGRHS